MGFGSLQCISIYSLNHCFICLTFKMPKKYAIKSTNPSVSVAKCGIYTWAERKGRFLPIYYVWHKNGLNWQNYKTNYPNFPCVTCALHFLLWYSVHSPGVWIFFNTEQSRASAVMNPGENRPNVSRCSVFLPAAAFMFSYYQLLIYYLVPSNTSSLPLSQAVRRLPKAGRCWRSTRCWQSSEI